MPDALRKTVSATEAPALFNASPYTTRWMLYRRFRHGEEAPVPEDARMSWGKKMERLVLDQAANDLALVVEPNVGEDGKQRYVRNGLLGCTRDARIFDPSRGYGACETKCVLDYRVWMERWDGGKTIPREIEIQLQQQMAVGDGDGSEPYRWGSLPVWVCGEMHYFEREPIPELWRSLYEESARFFDDVANDREPDPFGSPVESALLQKVFPLRKGVVLDLSREEDVHNREIALQWAEKARLLQWHTQERRGHDKGAKALNAELLALAKGCEEVRLPNGISVKLKEVTRKGYSVEASSYQQLAVHVPENLSEGEF